MYSQRGIAASRAGKAGGWGTVLLLLAASGPAAATPFTTLHNDPIAPVILGVTGILFFAILGRFAARRLGQPSVLGELIMGVLLGSLAYFVNFDLILVLREGASIFGLEKLAIAGESLDLAAFTTLSPETAAQVLWVLQGPDGGQILQVAHTVDVFSRYGVIFMLFLVGLDTSVVGMRRAGGAASRVAVIGVLMPFILGFAATRIFMPQLSLNTDLFVAATLGATDVGITARVFKDLHKQHTSEAHVIPGAAVIDDVLGLLMLAIVSGIIVSGGVHVANILAVLVLAVLFIAGVLFLGPYLLRFTIRLLCRLDLVEAKMFTSYLFVMVLAWLANLVGLATIIGAFAAGLIVNDTFFRHCRIPKEEYRVSIKALIMPLELILVPIFFILMGIQVKLEAFMDCQVLFMAGGLLVAAIAGKLICGFGASRGTNRLAVGLGMMPRGEVGLVFAAIGKSLGVITDDPSSAIVLMVIITALISPPLLKLALRSVAKPDAAPGSP